MFRTLLNIFRIPELRNKVLFTLAMLCVYRIGFWVPLPGVDAHQLAETAKNASNTALGELANYMSVFTGGSLQQSTIFGLGIMPYISASIILQLLGTVIPSLEKMKKEGEPGIRKINEWTRYLTVAICVIQAAIYVSQVATAQGGGLLFSVVRYDYYGLFWVMGILALTGGSVFLMWLGEQIDEYGIGNGISLIITAGIVARMPTAILDVINGSGFGKFGVNWSAYGFWDALRRAIDVNGNNTYGIGTIVFLMAAFLFVVAGSILLTQAQRRIPVQQAKHMRGRKVYGGQKQYLPLRVNHAGVMPIIFASSLMIFPAMVARYVSNYSWVTGNVVVNRIVAAIEPGAYIYEVFYILMVFFFSYFWNTVQFNPKEMATQLRDYGSFIPGLRPGKRTAEYLEAVMNRITYVGAAFLSVIAVVPTVVAYYVLGGTSQDFIISQFLGGTGLLIVIQVMLDMVNRLEANLVMRNYAGFLDKGGDRGGPSSGGGGRVRRSSGGPVRGGPKPAPSSYRTDKPKGLPA